ncbi:MAG TPA: RbsD/FucU domain-containing protein [Stellaceae bacterium]|nr:RbsD/FucU domain-containing protein [Stellaceae bacterium]
MLKGIDPLLSPELLQILAAMGHGDTLAIADANFPGTSTARRLVRLDGADAPRALAAVLSVLPLDSFVALPAAVMAVIGDPGSVPPVVEEFRQVVQRSGELVSAFEVLDRHAFYERAAAAFAIVMTGERRFYGNIILTKGVVPPPADPASAL